MPKIDAQLIKQDLSRIIEMAWEDRTTFESIKALYGLDEPALKKLMKSALKASSYNLWRNRVKEKSIKHAKLRSPKVQRAYCPTQYKISR